MAVQPGTYPRANGLAYDAARQLVYLTTMGPALDGTGRLYVKSTKDSELFYAVASSPTGTLDGVSGHIPIIGARTRAQRSWKITWGAWGLPCPTRTGSGSTR